MQCGLLTTTEVAAALPAGSPLSALSSIGASDLCGQRLISYGSHAEGSNSLNDLANLHITIAFQNREFLQVLLPDSMQKYGMVHNLTLEHRAYCAPQTSQSSAARSTS